MYDHIRKYAKENYLESDNNFAYACYRDNSIEDLACVLINVANGADIDKIADETDCKNWGITPQQWFDGIKAAHNQLVSEATK